MRVKGKGGGAGGLDLLCGWGLWNKINLKIPGVVRGRF